MPVTHNRYRPATTPHIIPAEELDAGQKAQLVNGCPAGLFRYTADGGLTVDFHGCLECGTCRLLCDPDTLARWQYPASGFGIVYRFG
ncbi:ferredoxin family protein [Enterobacter sp. ENT03]|uniref:ferredoxin family protein n=1 Tax=Enterobacter sp. ENT03 TaxID=2854780 RepID=UPI001C470999|nr:ferredoxin family protein [Enterobacter sp. ENT03]MBV7404203.1 ferredoxin family protein [Enterobacter sp. ENT03]